MMPYLYGRIRFSSSMSSPTQVPKPKRANRGKNMTALIEKEGLDEDGRPMKHLNLHRQQKRKRKQPKKTMQEEVEDEDDDEDRDFSDSSSGDVLSSESESNVSDNTIPNHEEDIKEILRSLPASVTPSIKYGLIDAHTKLSDYYHKYDESPFYTWAALLDPRISYEGMELDYAGDESLSEHLESSKKNL
ncbi:hypothetical protein JB92DRAFT_1915932 [Gautieria morchelliformis]|nr:hypothetical protein JB92DRAFT_1915932 [Gautieria morchelliformis]